MPRSLTADDDAPGDLLDLLADDGTISTEYEWELFATALRTVAEEHAGRVNPNDVRRLIRGQVKPCRIGAFYRRARLEGLIAYSGEFVHSDDAAGRNAGKPVRVYRWAA